MLKKIAMNFKLTSNTHSSTSLGQDIFAIMKHECRYYAYNRVLVIFIIGFLLLLSTGVFLVGDFLDTNVTSLSLQWQMLPWLCIIFIPALAMRNFDSQTQSGVMDLILSKPLSEITIIAGKWLSGVVVLFFILLLTIPFLITQFILGQPDLGVAMAGYLGAFFMLSSIFALSMLAAIICREQVTSFILGVFLITVLFLVDFDVVGKNFLTEKFSRLGVHIYQFSPRYWMREISSGQIQLAALWYFISFILLSLAASCYQFRVFRKPPRNSLAFATLTILSLGTTCILPAVSSSSLAHQNIFLDVTDQSEFTLHPETLEIINELDKKTYVTLYVSADLGSVPAPIVQHIDRVRRTFKQLASLSNDKLELDFVALSPDTEAAESAEIIGINKVPMTSGDILYFGVSFQQSDRKLVSGYINYNRAESLEYDIALQINNLSRQSTPRVALISSLLKPSHASSPHPALSIIEELKAQYDVSIIPYFSDGLAEEFDVLVLMDLPIIKRSMLEAIDSHIMSGKGALIMVDPYQRMNSANAKLKIKNSQNDELLTLNDLLRSYGLNFSSTSIVGDAINSATVESDVGKRYTYPYWLRLRNDSISKTNSVTAHLNELFFAESGYFTSIGSDVEVETLVTTGSKVGVISRSKLNDHGAEYLAANFIDEESGPKNIVVRLKGIIESPFNISKNNNIDSPASVYVIGDVDWIYNGFSLSNSQMGDRIFSERLNDNFSLFLNIVEQLAGDPRLTEIRSRGNPIRTFTTVEKILSKSQKAYQGREKDYLRSIQEAESSIAAVMRMVGVQTYDELPSDLKKRVYELRALTLPIKRDLRELRLKIREEIENLFALIQFFNFITGPFVALVFFLTARKYRFARHT